jgi:uncharacterized protein YjdB
MNEKNEILEEIWEARRKIEKENKNDLEEIFKTYQKRQQEKPSGYFSGNPVHIQKTKAA